MNLESSPGTYVLCFQSRVNRKIDVGRFGQMSLQPGFYLYIGSAHGAGGIKARVSRHVRRDKVKRWHIDYLRTHVRLLEVWVGYGERRSESEWSACVEALTGAEVAMAGFGASDCPGEQHLFYFRELPSISKFKHRCGDNIPVSKIKYGDPA